jgi:hypothetical protein
MKNYRGIERYIHIDLTGMVSENTKGPTIG